MNWSGYYYKLQDSWTEPLLWCPRWFNANGYATLTDYVSSLDTRVQTTLSLTSATSSIIPQSWLLTTSTPTSGNLLQRFFEVFVNEKEFSLPALNSVRQTRQGFFDITQPLFAWLVESIDPVETLTVAVGSGTVSVSRAKSDLELFYSAEWKWKQDNTNVLIYGLDIQSLEDQRYTAQNNWHAANGFDLAHTAEEVTGDIVLSNTLFVEHPETKNWFPYDPSKIREDGFLGLIYAGALRLRIGSLHAAETLPTVIVFINGEKKLARRVQLYNSVDEKGNLFNLSRRYEESNLNFGRAILKSAWFRGQTHRKVKSTISASIRQGTLTTVAASANSFTVPASAKGYIVRNIDPWSYTSEILTYQVSGTTDQFYTMYASGEIGQGYVRQLSTSFTSVSGRVSFDTYVNNKIDRPLVNWKLSYLTQTGSTVTLTDNFPHEVPSLIVFFPAKVEVNRPSTLTLKKSFNKTSPKFKWDRYYETETITGLATFDF